MDYTVYESFETCGYSQLPFWTLVEPQPACCVNEAAVLKASPCQSCSWESPLLESSGSRAPVFAFTEEDHVDMQWQYYQLRDDCAALSLTLMEGFDFFSQIAAGLPLTTKPVPSLPKHQR